MRAYLATNIVGSFAFDKKGTVIDKRLFPKRPEVIAEKLDMKGLLPEEEELLKKLISLGYKEVFTDKKASFPGIAVLFDDDNHGKKILSEHFRELAMTLKWVTSQAELNELLTAVQMIRTRLQLRLGKRDKIIMLAVGVLEEMEKSLNNFSERVREWYGLHFPELSSQVKSHEKFLELVSQFGNRDQMKEFKNLAEESAGMEFSGEDIQEIQSFSKTLYELHQRKKSLTAYLERACRQTIPNTSHIAGEILGARLLATAGGLEKLSRMPSSTVQLLGAEKALFRHIKGGGKAPKYGLLFGHPLVQNAPQEKKGKIARLIAAKISLASKTDFFSKEDKGEALKKELEEQVKRALAQPL